MKTPKTNCDIIIPVYNEEKKLEKSIKILKEFLDEHLQLYNWKIIIVDNGSTDRTGEIGRNIAREDSKIEYIQIKEKGKGGAIKYALSKSRADIMSFMDIDLSTNLISFPRLTMAILDGSDIAIGSRFIKGAFRKRSLTREIISRCYSLTIKMIFHTNFSDAPCGFKAMSRKTVDRVLPYIKDKQWFFDSEFLIIAEKAGFRIKEIPVNWIEDKDTRVDILKVIFNDIKGLIRIKRAKPWKLISEV